MRRSVEGSGDLKGAMGSGFLSSVRRGALCVSEMMRTLVLMVDGAMIGRDDAVRERRQTLPNFPVRGL